MKKRLVSILIANLFIAAPAFAQSDDFKLHGSVSLGGLWSDDKDVKDPSKMTEYMDLSDGALFGWDVKGRGSKYWLDFFGENIGRDDQYINLRGGMYEGFKYRLYTDSLRHNFLMNGITPYGSNNVAVFPQLNTATWNSIDMGYKRRDGGGYFEYQGATPWYFRVDGNQVQTKGSKPGAASQGMSPSNGFVELQFPVDYETKNASVEGGYATKKMALSLVWLTSKFSDNTKTVDWTNGYFGNARDTSYLAPDNKYQKILANATFRQLPGASTLAVRYTQDELKSSAANGTLVLNTTAGGYATTGPDVANFDGKIENQTFTVALASTPMKGLDTRVYYNYYKRDDKSTSVTFNSQGATGAGGPFENEGFSYKKNNFGADAFYRFNRENRFGLGIDVQDTDRTRFDFDNTKDRLYWVEWKNSSVENLGLRFKYAWLNRDSNFLLGSDGVNASDPNYLNRFVTAFDDSGVNQQKAKLTLDWSPVEFLDLSFEGIAKKNDFKENVLGRNEDKRQEYYISGSYGPPDTLRGTLFFDGEKATYDSTHRIYPFGSTGPVYDATMAPTATAYNWGGKTTDKNYAIGAALTWPATDKLMVKASYIYYKTDGAVDLSLQDGTPATVVKPASMQAWDDSKRQSWNLKGIYAFNKSVTFTAGWAYEKYDYTDAQYEGYRYTIPAATRQDSYLNGIYANPDYKTNIVYVLVGYNF